MELVASVAVQPGWREGREALEAAMPRSALEKRKASKALSKHNPGSWPRHLSHLASNSLLSAWN